MNLQPIQYEMAKRILVQVYSTDPRFNLGCTHMLGAMPEIDLVVETD